jgi:transposase
MTYSRDFRRQVLAIRDKENLSMALVAKHFGVSLKSVLRWSKNIEAKTTRHKPATKIDMEALKMDVKTYPDALQSERGQRLGVSEGCVFHALKRLGVSYKKNPQSPQSGQRKTLCILRHVGGI